MKKTFLRKKMSAVILGTAITTLLSLGVSAQWKLNSDRTWSYTEEKETVKGWENISNAWHYFNLDGKMETGWIYDKGTWYYLNESGAMQKGWVDIKGTWYYLGSSGIMQKGWVNSKGNWFYLNESGAMQKGWSDIKGTWYYLGSSGIMQRGWVNSKGNWYYLDDTGAMKTGWIRNNSYWYYLDDEEGMLTGRQEIGGRIYYFDKSGKLQITNNSIQTTNNNAQVSGQGATVDVNVLPELPQKYTISIQSAAENKILQLMNQKRTEAGLKPLTMENTLLQVARYKSNHMIQYDYFDHTTPQGNDWTSWLKTMGYKYATTGENIAYNNYDAVELFNQWWNSPGHKANMMNASFNKVGIGVIHGNGKYMGTQTFSN